MVSVLIETLKFILPKKIWDKLKLCIRCRLKGFLNEGSKPPKKEWKDHPQVTIGRYTYGVNPETIPLMESRNWRLDVGSFCSIAPSVRFVFGLHELNTPTTFPIREFVRKEWNPDLWVNENISIGHDVWIASNALILSGAKIGHGAVIAAGAVVTGEVPAYAVVAGVPAKVLRMRMTPDRVQQMLAIAWWEWPEEKILENEGLFYGNVDSFISAHSKVFYEINDY